jgi:muramoyltetrapeptide carboxypeptidase
MIKTPPYLQIGDTIGIVCPASYMAMEKAQACIDSIKSWGFKVKIGKTLGAKPKNYFSGTDTQRLSDLQRMLDNDKIKAVLCARGGYGTGRIIDNISFEKFKKKPKWIIGFSDVTILHAHVYSNYNIASVHSPMAAAFNNNENKNEFVRSLQKVLMGEKIRYACHGHPFNKNGKSIGELVGGNLSLLAHLSGTTSAFDTNGRILFIEDVGEYLYNIDRMLYQLKRNGKLNGLSALIVGGFTDMKDTERPFGKNVYEIIRDIISGYDFPVCFNFPVGHQRENYALKIGAVYTLTVRKNKVTLQEQFAKIP